MTVFSLGWGTRALEQPRRISCILQMIGVIFFGLMIPVAALLSDRFGMRPVMIIVAF